MNLYPDLRRTEVMEDVVQRMRKDVTVTLAGDSRRENADSFRVSYVSNGAEHRPQGHRAPGVPVHRAEPAGPREPGRQHQPVPASRSCRTPSSAWWSTSRSWRRTESAMPGSCRRSFQGNLQNIQNTSLQFQALNESTNRAHERRLLIERQIADTEALPLPAGAPAAAAPAGTVMTTSQQLALARARMTALLQRYTPDHPEVVTLERLISDLLRMPRTKVRSSAGNTRATVVGGRSRATKKRPGPEGRAASSSTSNSSRTKPKKPSSGRASPRCRPRVDALPGRESELVELTRDYSTLQAAYSSLLMKREDSAIAANLERRQIGEQFRILDPASMPEKPFNELQRLGVMASGAAAGLVLGLLLVGVKELRDSSFRDEDEVARAVAAGAGPDPGDESTTRRTAAPRAVSGGWTGGVGCLLVAIAVVVVWRCDPESLENMYQQFYGLRELPFELTPNPRYLFLTGTAARGAEHAAVRPVVGQIASTLLVGEAGTGKTTLIRAALESDAAATCAACT